VTDEAVDTRTYLVVRNDEEQFSIWWADRPLPDGWYAEGPAGNREQCLARIGQLWTDMRPASLRRRMEQRVTASTAN